MIATRAEVYAALDSERAYQQTKHDGKFNQAESWVVFMESYLGEAQHQASRTDLNNPYAMQAFLATIRKVTALGVACMEAHGAPVRFIPGAPRGYAEEGITIDQDGNNPVLAEELVEDEHRG